MLTEFNLKFIFDKLVEDESFCRFLYYGDNPLGDDKPDITKITNYKIDMMQHVIRFSAQIEDLEEKELVRICLYKDYSKLGNFNDVIRDEVIQFDIYVPHRLQNNDMRIYKIENKIANILDRLPMNMGYLDYIEGKTSPIPPILGYALYRMTFRVEEGRSAYGKY